VSFAMLTACVSLACFGAVHAAARLFVRCVPGSADRDGVLFARGIAPAAVAAIGAFGVALPAFLLFEPRHENERVGMLLLGAAALGAAQLVRMAARAGRMLYLSRALTRRWTATAAPLHRSPWGMPAFAIDADFPVVAVAGLLRPRLFVDRRVLDTCSDAEVEAIAAHERAHVRHRDNVRRLIIGACEGPLSAAAASWRQAAEHAADACAADSARRGLDLASALLKLARLAGTRSLEGAAVSTVHDGASLETRIRRLVDRSGAGAPATRSSPLPLVTLAIAGAALASVPGLLDNVHRLLETLVRLP
jgi:hypothetical protein